MYRRLKTLDFHGLQPPFLALYDTERYHGSTQCDDVGCEDWEAGRRRPPEYIPRMISYQLKYEELLQELRS